MIDALRSARKTKAPSRIHHPSENEEEWLPPVVKDYLKKASKSVEVGEELTLGGKVGGRVGSLQVMKARMSEDYS